MRKANNPTFEKKKIALLACVGSWFEGKTKNLLQILKPFFGEA